MVTGARLVKHGHMLHIQIEEGKILPGGGIDHSTIKWKPILKPRNRYEKEKLNYQNFKGVYLGLSEVPQGKVIVGLKLSKIYHGDQGMLSVETLSAVYNYNTGDLSDLFIFYDSSDTDTELPPFDQLPNYNYVLPKEYVSVSKH